MVIATDSAASDISGISSSAAPSASERKHFGMTDLPES
jgi:hypothetical protein